MSWFRKRRDEKVLHPVLAEGWLHNPQYTNTLPVPPEVRGLFAQLGVPNIVQCRSCHHLYNPEVPTVRIYHLHSAGIKEPPYGLAELS